MGMPVPREHGSHIAHLNIVGSLFVSGLMVRMMTRVQASSSNPAPYRAGGDQAYNAPITTAASIVSGLITTPMFLQTGTLSLDDGDGVFDSGFFDVDSAEAAIQRRVLSDGAAIFLMGSRADTHDLTTRQRRFEDVGRVEVAVNRIARADDGV
jgi:hypothetical protein